MKVVILLLLLSLAISDDDILLEDYKNIIKRRIRNNMYTCPAELNFLIMREIDDSDNPDSFFTEGYINNIRDFPIEGVVGNKPWSGHYWPIKYGSISARYNNNEKNTMKEFDSSGGFGRKYSWNESVRKYSQPDEHNNFYNLPNFENYVNENYSPSEKYDLLVGDYDYTLTNALKDEGNYMVRDSKGDVPEWMGICHGWSPASMYEREPYKAVTITAADGRTNIQFLPHDIEALISMYWSEAKFATKFIGNECKYKDHKTIPSDSETGLWEDNSCFSINPGSMLITFANQIGIKNKNLIFDPDTRGEIWNQPVYKYSLEYFNVLNNEVGSLSECIQDIKSLSTSEDRFVNFIFRKKSPNTMNVVGVHMTVYFVMESEPVHREKVETNDRKTIKEMRYSFSIELDGSLNVIGGEWLSNKHPVFIWDVDEPQHIRGMYDNISFNGSSDDLRRITSYAKDASSRYKVLKSIVKYLQYNSSN
jgi:hypothetical protein